ncbi:hypothetical protein SAMN05444156_1492 [Verrucomicrobium sp. GAS474]|uniref:hypothetical protein n=1 Tax=Verrucomicrobium sp. GAS474 TaxID=1882831 RepID=UPI00087CEDA5|nr:hypothetical protein [Verrucomicrobium sp. GAS474]SDU02174.1 hypothetical protein SAMN05444156_1492 [Verrucomicrobium sp. GAS474]
MPHSTLSRFAIVVLASGLLLMGGCMAVDETSLYADEPLGSDYLPVVTRSIQLWPGKILVLPVSGAVEDQARSLFESQFVPALKDKMRWIMIPYPGVASTRVDLPITEAQALAKAKETGADAILFVKLSQEQIYPPLRIVVDVFMQDVETQKTVLTMHADYDANNLAVVESARRYAKKYLPKSNSPERSKAILHDLRSYLTFSGYYTGKLISDSFLVPAKQAQRAQAADPNYGTPFATPPESLSGSTTSATVSTSATTTTTTTVAPAPPAPPAPSPAPNTAAPQPDYSSAPQNSARPGPSR